MGFGDSNFVNMNPLLTHGLTPQTNFMSDLSYMLNENCVRILAHSDLEKTFNGSINNL